LPLHPNNLHNPASSFYALAGTRRGYRHHGFYLYLCEKVVAALLHNSQAVDNKNEFLWHFYNNFRLSQGQLKTYATTPLPDA
jgi:hypothetical protein